MTSTMLPIAIVIGKIRGLSGASEQKSRKEGNPAQLHGKFVSYGTNIARISRSFALEILHAYPS
jgi:hypothetical protein